ncbi:RNA polymerase sigma-H factor [Neolewinella maritima]|uniref:RNA polymerase sigma-H factor n=1 Tax=Neolewinella maritima TaxID=1383882 RepID=A0ABN8F5N5_9BACT|nr:RNA polymerase sigma factor [Neolewinella maritima]CAH0999547.1 RNA polymerase sigma-H factor [Neolewinella maritima]
MTYSSPTAVPPAAAAGLTDRELVAVILDGKRAYLNELYRRYQDRVYYKCLGMVRDASQAQDLAHDVFIKVFTNLHKYQGNADLSFWIYAITYNHCVSHLKKAKRLRFDTMEESVDAVDGSQDALHEKLLHDLQLDQLDRLLKRLPREDEVLLTLKYQEAMSVKQIAAILQLSESAVKMRLLRCRERLAKLLNGLSHA